MKASELMDNEGNWRTHPDFQRDALAGILGDVGIADVLKVYHSERQGGLTLIDGHLRKNAYPDVEWPVVILDLTDAEADLMLATFDPLAALATMDKEKALALAESVVTDDLALREMLLALEAEARSAGDEDEGDEEKEEHEGPPEMELQPFEHYDYIVLMFKTSFDFERALDVLGIEKVGFTAHSTEDYEGKIKRKLGIGRVINGALVLNKLCQNDS
jgi:hypothetical protein